MVSLFSQHASPFRHDRTQPYLGEPFPPLTTPIAETWVATVPDVGYQIVKLK